MWGSLMYVGPGATHLLGCYFTWGLGQRTLLGIVVDLMWGLGQHTLQGIVVGLCGGLGRHTSLGIVVGLCEASGNTLYWISLLVYEGLEQHILLSIVVGYAKFRATHFTGHHCKIVIFLGNKFVNILNTKSKLLSARVPEVTSMQVFECIGEEWKIPTPDILA
jgi:hypothetical protein